VYKYVLFLAGYYLYVEASNYWQSLDNRAVLVSRTVSQDFSSYKCLIFYYHMFGSDMGTLNVYFRNYTGHNNLQLSFSGNQGDQWKMGRKSFSHQGPFQV
jgi:hypothetical protein